MIRRYVNAQGVEILTPCEIIAPGWTEEAPAKAPAPAVSKSDTAAKPARKPTKKKET